MEALASIVNALIGGLAGASPMVYFSLLVTLGCGFGWWTEAKAGAGDRKAATERFDAMVKDKDDRYDKMVTDAQEAVREAQEQVRAINTDWTATNRENSDSLLKITEALQHVAETLATMGDRAE
jgi:hypothetical protein